MLPELPPHTPKYRSPSVLSLLLNARSVSVQSCVPLAENVEFTRPRSGFAESRTSIIAVPLKFSAFHQIRRWYCRHGLSGNLCRKRALAGAFTMAAEVFPECAFVLMLVPGSLRSNQSDLPSSNPGFLSPGKLSLNTRRRPDASTRNSAPTTGSLSAQFGFASRDSFE